MSYRHINAARDVEGLDPTARHVLLVIATFTNAAGVAWCSQQTIARAMGRSRGAVWGAVKRLQLVAPVGVTHRPGRTDRYDLRGLCSGPGVARPDCTGVARLDWHKQTSSVLTRAARSDEAAAPQVEKSDVAPGITEREIDPFDLAVIELCPYCDEFGWLWRGNAIRGRCTHRPTRATSLLTVADVLSADGISVDE